MERKSKSLDPFTSTVTGDKNIWHGVNIGFVTYKQLIGELIGTMKYRCEITKSNDRRELTHFPSICGTPSVTI